MYDELSRKHSCFFLVSTLYMYVFCSLDCESDALAIRSAIGHFGKVHANSPINL
jgi:hypothetical protein